MYLIKKKMKNNFFVDAQWLQKEMKNIKLFDCSWYPKGRDTFKEYQTKHIPNAMWFGLDEVADLTPRLVNGNETVLPHMYKSIFNYFFF